MFSSEMNKYKKIILAVDSLRRGNGGIACVSRLTAKFLSKECLNKCNAKVLLYSDPCINDDINLKQQLAKKNQLKFFLKNQLNAFNHDFFLYDFSGIARAHSIIPGFRKPCLTWIHGIEVWESGRSLYANTAKRSTILVSNSDYTLKRAQKIHGVFPNARVCWLGTETDKPSKLDPPSQSCINVSIIGRIDKHSYKGHFPLIKCWPEIIAKIPKARLLIVGDGPGRNEVLSAIEKSPAASFISLRGFIPENKMEEIWKNTRILAMPSRGEGFGLVYIEAMRHGRPVIASIHDAASEINIDGQTGYNIDLNIPEQLVDRIVYLLKNYNKAIEMGNNGIHRWRQHFSYSAFSNRFKPIFNEFIR